MSNTQTNQAPEVSKFYPGQKLVTRWVCDSSSTIEGEVISRTAKTVTVNVIGEGTKRYGIGISENQEYIRPFGRYSMAPIFRA